MINLFKFLKKKTSPSILIATLNARMQPIHRDDLEDAFNASMEEFGSVARVVGGGTAFARSGEIEACDLEIEVDEVSDASIGRVIGVLESVLAPKGSRLVIPSRSEPVSFGVHEGLAVYLNGADLAADVYRTCDVNYVIEEGGRLLEGVGHIASHWEGQNETALYIYGKSFTDMSERLLPFLNSYPLCAKCRLEQIA
jgi:hypothetical protein